MKKTRITFEMTQEQLITLLANCKPVPYMIISGMEPPSQQDNANREWKQLGEEMGFDYRTVQPGPGLNERFFTAEIISNHDERIE